MLAIRYQPESTLFMNGTAGRCAQPPNDLRQTRRKVLTGQVIFNKIKDFLLRGSKHQKSLVVFKGVTIERKMYHVRCRAAQLSPKACDFSVTG